MLICKTCTLQGCSWTASYFFFKVSSEDLNMAPNILVVAVIWMLRVNTLKVYPPPDRQLKDESASGEVPGIQYISRGYNIMFGNPHTTGNVDKGISLPIWDLSNVSNGQTYNGYSVPNGVTKPVPASTCTQDFTFNAVSGANSFSKSLSSSTSFDVKIFKAAFSASADYQTVYTQTSKNKMVVTSSYTQCAVYSASLKLPNTPPTFDENFYLEIEQMPNEYNNKNESNLQFFYDFFTKYFGTHYISQITMGGIFGTLSSMESFSYSTFSSSNLDIKTSASYSTIGASAAASSMNDKQKNESADFNSITKSQEIFNIGGNLPASGDWSLWQSQLEAKPMPIYYALQPIPGLLKSQYFPKIKDISKKQSALQSALNDYCSILAKNNSFGVIDCNGYPPDPAIPGESIVKGFYTSNIDNEPKNPYTNGIKLSVSESTI